MYVIETKNLTKRFGDFTANNNINLQVKKGDIHAIVGENGAGKSTLMNMLYGLLQPTEGEIHVKGKKTKITNPKDAIAMGIGMVHQHFKLVPSFTVYENILLGDEITKGIKINKKEEINRIDKLIKEYGYDIDSKSKIQDISIGTEQKVEILKMLYRDVDIIILDEPTAVLTPQEVDELLDNLQELKASGKTIIIITHKLNEVKRCSDKITVIRKGQVINTVNTEDVSEPEIAKMMVGRDVLFNVNKEEKQPGNNLISVKDLTVIDKRKTTLLNKLNFNIRCGEVLGVAGVEGNGQSELVKVLTGLMKSTSGEVIYENENITKYRAEKLRKIGIGIIPEDRYKQGLCKQMKISDNLIAGYHDAGKFGRNFHYNHKLIQENRNKLTKQYDIRTGEGDGNVSQLSGGNAQKVIIARELSADPNLIIASQPTRGVDIGSIEFIHQELIKMRDNGKAVLLISSELSEIMNLSDRIIVMYKGSIIAEISAKEASKAKLGLLMAGVKEKSEVEKDGEK